MPRLRQPGVTTNIEEAYFRPTTDVEQPRIGEWGPRLPLLRKAGHAKVAP